MCLFPSSPNSFVKEEKISKVNYAQNMIDECKTAIELLSLEVEEEVENALVKTLNELNNFLQDFKIETFEIIKSSVKTKTPISTRKISTTKSATIIQNISFPPFN